VATVAIIVLPLAAFIWFAVSGFGPMAAPGAPLPFSLLSWRSRPSPQRSAATPDVRARGFLHAGAHGSLSALRPGSCPRRRTLSPR